MKCASALLLALAVTASVAAAAPLAAPELAPYRALARDRALAEGALQAARIGLAGALGDGDAPRMTRVPEWPGSPRPVYVTLVRGRTSRACVGSDVPLGGSLAATLMQLGERLADSDLRRPPVRAEELDTLRLVVAFASDAISVRDPMTVDPAREGLKIEGPQGAVAFLPGEARTIAWAIREARHVLGSSAASGRTAASFSDFRYSRFSVVTLSGPATTRSHRSSGEKP